MKPEEIRSMGDADIARHLEDTQREFFNLRLRLATRQLNNTSEMRKVRKDIARLKTAIKEREISREMQRQEGGTS
ncbi:MAG: 50S ribosomal protein L29 [Dehalococcoidia bacterium]|nr:50S ribosomal protein L29 [Dehalococcoidia bacterium]